MHYRAYALLMHAHECCKPVTECTVTLRRALAGAGWATARSLDKVVMTTSPNQDPVHLQVRCMAAPARTCVGLILLP